MLRLTLLLLLVLLLLLLRLLWLLLLLRLHRRLCQRLRRRWLVPLRIDALNAVWLNAEECSVLRLLHIGRQHGLRSV